MSKVFPLNLRRDVEFYTYDLASLSCNNKKIYSIANNMHMKNRFYGMGRALIGALLLLSMSGIVYSCKDDYDLDTRKPTFLGGSIYDELKARGFNYTVRLIEDLGYKDVMAQTGSKTLFVASDAAYDQFFRNNKWGVTSYDQLTAAQKRMLFNGAQLNNAYVIEMMANGADGQKNLCLRQNSAAAAVDTVPFWKTSQLPVNYSEDKSEKKFWARHEKSGNGILMAIDATEPMITHFLEGNMKEKGIKRSDVAFLLNDANGWSDADGTRAYIFDARVTEQDVVCLNGYFHVVDKVLVPPGNMAEEIRTNGETNLFSHILDRFSAPFYNAVLTDNYKALYQTTADSVYEKRYFAVNTRDGRLVKDPDNVVNNEFPLLPFDPGWNAYAVSSSEVKEKDMAAMFVPDDEALREYFLTGSGRVLMERYATKPNTAENLEYNVDQIPLDIVQALVNNLMKVSFSETVPSKYYTIMNDARDQMFPPAQYPNETEYKKVFKKCLIANNGVVYIMNRVITPADYAAVIAPSLYSNNTTVVRTVIRADDSYIQGSDYAKAPLQQYFSTYLKAMQSRFSFFVPNDEGLKTFGYVDPASLSTGNKNNFMYYRWSTESSGKANDGAKRIAVSSYPYRYNMQTGQQLSDRALSLSYVSKATDPLSTKMGMVKQKLLIEMINHHIVVHDNNDTKGMDTRQKYFLSREGAPVIVNTTGRGKGMEVNGGFQEQLTGAAKYTCTVQEVYDQTRETNKGYGNGMTYILDRPMQATTITTYKALSAHPDFSKFLELCTGMDDDLLQRAGLRDSLMKAGADDAKGTEWKKVAARYYFFLQGEKGGSHYNVPSADRLVRFFNNYRYTVYVPTNTAIDAEITNGLPTWTTIKKYLDDNLQADVTLLPDNSNKAQYDAVKKHNDGVKAKAQAMITVLVNFLRYHFQDESLFVDQVTKTGDYTTSCVDEKTKVYLSLTVKQTPGRIEIEDLGHGSSRPVVVNGSVNNILVRDANFDNATAPSYIRSSSYAVVHQVDHALLFDKSLAGGYSSAWASTRRARAFVAKYRIKD